jgi:NADP-dependent 3-hydroxy acid dehydrogenase YdfG
MTRAVVPILCKQKWGRVINVSTSILGHGIHAESRVVDENVNGSEPLGDRCDLATAVLCV